MPHQLKNIFTHFTTFIVGNERWPNLKFSSTKGFAEIS